MSETKHPNHLPCQRDDREKESLIGEHRVVMGLTVIEFCKYAKITISEYNALSNGMMSPVYERGDGGIKKSAYNVCVFLGKPPEDVFPRYFCKLDGNNDLTEDQVIYLSHSQIEEQKDIEIKKLVRRAVDSLDEMSSRVIRMRFFEGLTLDEIGRHFCISRERVRQIESRALRMLRHSSRSAIFKDEYGWKWRRRSKYRHRL